MQDPAQTAPVAPPMPPRPGEATIILPNAPEITVTNVEAIRAMRRELSNQIISATERRNELAERLRNAQPEERAGLEARIRVLDDRIVQLERDLAETGRQLTANPAALVRSSREPAPVVWGGFSPGQATGMSIVFTIFVLAPLALAAARLMWRRARVPRTPLPADASQRLERIENSVDAMAIEVERVTEGQRFLTRLLTEQRSAAAIPAASDNPTPAPVHAHTIHSPGGAGG